MELSNSDVEKLAALARLRLTEDEVDRYQSNLGAILEYVERLRGFMAGKQVVADRRVVSSAAELRADQPGRPRTTDEQTELLASARAVKDQRVVVPGVFSKQENSKR